MIGVTARKSCDLLFCCLTVLIVGIELSGKLYLKLCQKFLKFKNVSSGRERIDEVALWGQEEQKEEVEKKRHRRLRVSF